ncbi:hypothetical protein CEXT_637901 [Caerostris extrusa]|uniref:Secreted protein n=1 Tax=Caerostris extrusa TaxID=172846 RepID=A0AAV4PA88_CAEEX|nr:hypothetical protein CEXT_637901 [Caerostris extrusa]
MFRISNSSLVRVLAVFDFSFSEHTEGRLQRSIIWSAFPMSGLSRSGFFLFFFFSRAMVLYGLPFAYDQGRYLLSKQVFNLLIGCPSLAWRNRISGGYRQKGRSFRSTGYASGVRNRSFMRWTG